MERLCTSTPAGEMYTLGSLVTPRSCLAAVAESESMRLGYTYTTQHYTTALDSRHITQTCVNT